MTHRGANGRHTRNGGTPTSGVMAPTVSNGQLTLPSNDFEIDARRAVDAHVSSSPRARAAERTKPPIAANSSGSSSRKAS